jgi:electron transport complex protein RnfB
MSKPSLDEIDALLPQTQCGLCGYGGCLPYAKALLYDKAAIHLCLPGGIETLLSLGKLLEQDSTPYLSEMAQKTKPEMLAYIREAECIGCTKCIQACPVDAIIGSAKQMHTVLTEICTGCELCVAPCPVDCIEMISTHNAAASLTKTINIEKANLSRERYHAKQQRLSNKKTIQATNTSQKLSLQKKQHFIQEAILRAKAKKNKQIPPHA